MDPGLYMPEFFSKQKYNNFFNIPFMQLVDEGSLFVSINYFRDLYSNNRGNKIFNNIVNELVLRGGVFKMEKQSALFPNANIDNLDKVILVGDSTPENAYDKLDLEFFNISYIKKTFGIENNFFYNYIPIEGFKVFGLENSDIVLLEREFINRGFIITNLKANNNLNPKQSLSDVNKDFNKEKPKANKSKHYSTILKNAMIQKHNLTNSSINIDDYTFANFTNANKIMNIINSNSSLKELNIRDHLMPINEDIFKNNFINMNINFLSELNFKKCLDLVSSNMNNEDINNLINILSEFKLIIPDNKIEDNFYSNKSKKNVDLESIEEPKSQEYMRLIIALNNIKDIKTAINEDYQHSNIEKQCSITTNENSVLNSNRKGFGNFIDRIKNKFRSFINQTNTDETTFIEDELPLDINSLDLKKPLANVAEDTIIVNKTDINSTREKVITSYDEVQSLTTTKSNISEKQLNSIKSKIGSIISINEVRNYLISDNTTFDFTYQEIMNDLNQILGNDYIINENYIFKENITDESIVTFLIEQNFKDKIFNLSSYRQYLSFISSAKKIKNNIFTDINENESVFSRLEYILDNSNEKVRKLEDKKYTFKEFDNNVILDSELVKDKVIISNTLLSFLKNEIKDIKPIDEIYKLLESKHTQFNHEEIKLCIDNLGIVLSDNFTVSQKYVYKKDISDKDIALYIMENIYKDKLFNLTDKNDYSYFIKCALEIKDDVFEVKTRSKIAITIRLETYFNSSLEIVNLGDGIYKYKTDNLGETTLENDITNLVKIDDTNKDENKIVKPNHTNKVEEKTQHTNDNQISLDKNKVTEVTTLFSQINFENIDEINVENSSKNNLIDEIKKNTEEIVNIEIINGIIDSNDYLIKNNLIDDFKKNLSQYLGEDYLVESKFICKKDISDRSVVLFVMKEYYSEKFLNLSNDRDYFTFMILLKSIKKKIYAYLDGNKYKTSIKIKAILDANSRSIMNPWNNKYKYITSNDIPVKLIVSLHRFIQNQLNNNNAVHQYQISNVFRRQISEYGYDGDSIYNYISLIFNDMFLFEDHTTLRSLRTIKNLNQEKDPKNIKCEREIDSKKIVFKPKSITNNHTNLKPEIKEIVKKNFKNLFDKKNYVIVKELYDSVQFESGVYEDLSEHKYDGDNFHRLLRSIYPDMGGNAKVMFKYSSRLNNLKILISEIGIKEKYSDSDFNKAIETLGYGEAWGRNFIEKSVKNKKLVPIDDTYYILSENFTLDNNSKKILEDFLNENINEKGYISLYKERFKLSKLPMVNNYNWNINIANYFATNYFGYKKLDIPYLKNQNDPYILVNKNSNINYKKIVLAEMTKYDDLIMEDDILLYFRDKGLLTRNTNQLTSFFFDSEIFGKDEIGKLIFLNGDTVG